MTGNTVMQQPIQVQPVDCVAIVDQRVDHGVDDLGLNQRLVALDVDDDVKGFDHFLQHIDRFQAALSACGSPDSTVAT